MEERCEWEFICRDFKSSSFAMGLVPLVKGHKPPLLFPEPWIMSGVSHSSWSSALELLFVGRLSLKIHLSLCFMGYTQNSLRAGAGVGTSAQRDQLPPPVPLLS